MGPLLPRVPQTSRHPTKASSVEGAFVEISDCEIHYSIKGTGKPILLLHGWGANIFCWRLLTPLLAQHYQVIEIDLPGSGRSTKVTTARYGLDDQCRRIAEFMDRLEIPEAHFVGSSLGGAISLWMGKTFPKKVLSIVALAPAAHRRVMPASLHHFSGFTRMIPQFVKHQLAVYSMHQVITRKELINKDTIGAYLGPFESADGSITLLKASEALRDRRLPQELRDLEIPVKILYGAKDNVVKRKFIDEILGFLPSTTALKVHSTAGHHVQEDEPQWVFEEIQSFLSK